MSYSFTEPEWPFEPEPQQCFCSPEQEFASMNAKCAVCREEFDQWCEVLEASGLLDEPILSEPDSPVDEPVDEPVEFPLVA
jgi:hypothetical protein